MLCVEGDWSNAAFFLSIGALSSNGMKVMGLARDSSQGDRAVLEILRGFGAEIAEDGESILIRRGTRLAPDPALAGRILRRGSLMLFSEGTWVLSETLQTALYNGRGGADVVSGMASSFAIANLFFVAFGGVTTSVSVLLGTSLGRGALEEARRRKDWLMSAALTFGLAMTLLGLASMLLVPIVFGRLRIVEDHARALDISRRLSYKFTDDEAYINYEIEKSGPGVLVFELIPDHMTGKLVNEK